MFRFYEITDAQRFEIDIWADRIIETNKQAMASFSKAWLLWSDWCYYQPEKDTWVDESWWIETAKQIFIKHKDDDNGMGTRVIPALEILVHHFPAEYRDYARDKIDRWFNQSYHDPEYWWDLIISVYPDHEATEFLLEEVLSRYDFEIPIRLGDLKTIDIIKENVMIELQEGGIYWVVYNLNKLNKTTFDKIFSRSESDQIQDLLWKIADRKLPVDPRDWMTQHSILETAIKLELPEIIDALSNNVNYLERFFDLFQSSATELLLWSLTNKQTLTENLVFQLYANKASLNRIHQLDFPSHAFALAIAWKRSQVTS